MGADPCTTRVLVPSDAHRSAQCPCFLLQTGGRRPQQCTFPASLHLWIMSRGVKKRPSRTTSMSSLLDPWAVLFQLVKEDQRLKSWVGNQKKGSETPRDPGEDPGLGTDGRNRRDDSPAHPGHASVGFFTRYDEDLREPLVHCQVSQVSMRVVRGSVSWLSSHGRGIATQDILKHSRGLSRVAAENPGFPRLCL